MNIYPNHRTRNSRRPEDLEYTQPAPKKYRDWDVALELANVIEEYWTALGYTGSERQRLWEALGDKIHESRPGGVFEC